METAGLKVFIYITRGGDELGQYEILLKIGVQ